MATWLPSEIGQDKAFAEKYAVESELGVGGSGIVVGARHRELDERVAIKFLLPGGSQDSEVVARFRREARAAARIKSQHVVRIRDISTTEGGIPFIVMEYLEGIDLERMLQQTPSGQLPIQDAIEFVLQAGEALAECHSLGIVHRDLKPSNLFCVLGADGLPLIKVLDFGISKLSSGTIDPSMTDHTRILGSPRYMSPEQFDSSADVDHRTDIWAIGVILYELFTGQAPFAGDHMLQLWQGIKTGIPEPLERLRPDLPADLSPIVFKCLEKDRRDRFSDMAELAKALAPFAPQRARSSIVRIVRTVSSPGVTTGSLDLPSPDSARASHVPAALSLPAERVPRNTGRMQLALTAIVLTALAIWIGGQLLKATLGKEAPVAERNERRSVEAPLPIGPVAGQASSPALDGIESNGPSGTASATPQLQPSSRTQAPVRFQERASHRAERTRRRTAARCWLARRAQSKPAGRTRHRRRSQPRLHPGLWTSSSSERDPSEGCLLKRRTRGWCSLAGVWFACLASTAHSEDGGRATYADHLFQEALALMKKDRCPEAIPKFLNSQQLDRSAATLVNLATCYARLGRPAAAWRTYRQAAELAESEKNDQLKERSFQAISLLMPTVTKLRVVAPREAATLSLTLNGEPLTLDDGFPIPLDPGENIIEAAAPGRAPWRRSINATELGATIVIEVPELRTTEPTRRPPSPQSTEAPEKSTIDLRVPAVILGGVGVTSIVIGSVLGFSAKASNDDSNGHCLNGRCTQEGYDLRIDAIDKARLSTYAIGFGTAIATTGVVLWFLSSRPSKHDVEVAPWVPIERSSWGVSIRGRL